jgi:hypothetical protein
MFMGLIFEDEFVLKSSFILKSVHQLMAHNRKINVHVSGHVVIHLGCHVIVHVGCHVIV